MASTSKLGVLLKKARTHRGETPQETARRMQISPSTVKRWESGATEPQGGLYRAVALAYVGGALPLREVLDC